jgi:hypothetical protein
MSLAKGVRDIYRNYEIMPALAAHQFRVAGVACAIMEAFDAATTVTSFYKNEVIAACLLHDMGNILKFDLASLPEFLEPEGLAYWEGVKAKYAAKYGTDEHVATLAIAEEIGVSARIKEYIEAVGFSNALKTAQSGSLEKMICCYADQRVAPHGVVSLAERMEEASLRYAGRAHRITDAAFAAQQFAALVEMEKRIFAHTAIVSDAITEAACEKYFASLEDFTFA